MSCQCAKCLGWLEETSYGNPFADGYRCRTCEWEAPLALLNLGLAAYPIEGYLEFAEHFYRLEQLYMKHLVPAEEDGWFKIADCELKGVDEPEVKEGWEVDEIEIIQGDPNRQTRGK